MTILSKNQAKGVRTLRRTHGNEYDPITRIETYAVSKNNLKGIPWRYTEYKLNACCC